MMITRVDDDDFYDMNNVSTYFLCYCVSELRGFATFKRVFEVLIS